MAHNRRTLIKNLCKSQFQINFNTNGLLKVITGSGLSSYNVISIKNVIWGDIIRGGAGCRLTVRTVDFHSINQGSIPCSLKYVI